MAQPTRDSPLTALPCARSQVLHDAFFKFQSKPRLSRFGDTYYEGKEHEVQLRQKKPGVASDELQKALGMELGGPPPWLINMQRYGPPPSYPNLKIAGLNAPIPEGATYGYHPGGWGKPPVDEFGRGPAEIGTRSGRDLATRRRAHAATAAATSSPRGRWAAPRHSASPQRLATAPRHSASPQRLATVPRHSA